MSRKRLNREDQIELDTERLNDALDELIAQLGTTVQGSDVDLQRAALQSKMRLDAIKLLPGLLERKAKLLGLDVTSEQERGMSGTLAELERKLALVGPGKAS